MKKDITLFVAFIVVFLTNCGVANNNDVYIKYPIGSKLTLDVLRKAEQIYPNKLDVILLVNISDNPEKYDPHLLFYDSTLTLYSACYFVSEKIEKINMNVITAFLNEERSLRKKYYREDLPSKYKFDLIVFEGGAGQQCNKIIQKSEMDSSVFSVDLYVKKSLGLYSGYRNDVFSDSVMKKEFFVNDTLSCLIRDLHFDYQKKMISVRNRDINNHLIWDEMLVGNVLVLDTIYSQIWKKLLSNRHEIEDSGTNGN